MNHCLRHYEEPTAAVCRSCKGPFCTRCLVFSFGPKKPPYCVGCALIASGVRNGNLKDNRERVAGETALDAQVSAGREPETFDWSRPIHNTIGGGTPNRESFSDSRSKRSERHGKKSGSIFGRRKKGHDRDGDPSAGGSSDESGSRDTEPLVAASPWSAPESTNEVRDTRIPAPSQLRLAALAALAREL